MATIRIHCPHCTASALLGPQQILLLPHRSGATYLFTCPTCTRVTDGPGCSTPATTRASTRICRPLRCTSVMRSSLVMLAQ